LKETVEFISNFKKIAVVSHERPDGDAVGSVLGFVNFLEKRGFEAFGVLKDGVPQIFRFINGWKKIVNFLPDSEVYILVDASDWNRTGFEKTG